MNNIEPMKNIPYDTRELNRKLDITKSKIFLGKNSAFFGSLLCSLDFFWTEGINTACTNGNYYAWNPAWFLSLHPDARVTVLLHEIWHCARLHLPRIGSRDPLIWNIACDIVINNNLERDGYKFIGIENCWKDQSLFGKAEEDIYDLLMKNAAMQPPSGGSWGNGDDGGDLQPCQNDQKNVNDVIRATHTAEQQGQAGSIPGDVREIVDAFMDPVVPWEQYIHKFLTEQMNIRYKWNRPNRRYRHIYLPSRQRDQGKLGHVVVFIDVSGSISREQIKRVIAELVHIHRTYKPDELTLIQFDTRLTREHTINSHDDISSYEIIGGGGTCLIPVRDWIESNEPTAVIVFSDLEVQPMKQLSKDIPFLWVVLDNNSATVPFGEKVHVKSASIKPLL